MSQRFRLKTLPAIARQITAWFLLFMLQSNYVSGQNATGRLLSPDNKLEINFQTGQVDKNASANQLFYTVSFKGKQLFKPSALSLDIKGAQPLGADVHITGSKMATTDQTYQLVVGKASRVHDHYNALQLELEENTAPGRKLIIEARAYNDAVAFRYIAPSQQALQNGYELLNENTEFHFGTDAITYAQVLPHYRSMYESEYLKLSVSAFSNQGGVKSNVLIGLPMLAEVPGVGWVAIAESELQGYSSMYLTNPAGGWSGHTMLSRLAPRLDSSGTAVKGKGSIRSAWRIIMVGDDPGRIIESNAVMNLSSPSAIANTDWIKGGKASWDWWSGSLGADGKPAFTTANMKYYVCLLYTSPSPRDS